MENRASATSGSSVLPIKRPIPATYATLASSIAMFLNVTLHQILFHRNIYPQSSFVAVRQYNYPVQQSRHPKVCAWVTDACAASETQLLKCAVASVSVVILCVNTNKPMERFTFDLSRLPRVRAQDIHTPFESSVAATAAGANKRNSDNAVSIASSNIDLEAQFRAVLARLGAACARLAPLPEEEEYVPTLHMILHPGADAPAGLAQEDQVWIAADPNHAQNHIEDSNDCGGERASNLGEEAGINIYAKTAGARTLPVRTVDAGEMKLDVWVEESKSKLEELERIKADR